MNQSKNWYNNFFSVFRNSHSLTTHLFSASIFIPLGHTDFFETYLTWKLILQGVKWHSFRWWCRKLNQIILPDRGDPATKNWWPPILWLWFLFINENLSFFDYGSQSNWTRFLLVSNHPLYRIFMLIFIKESRILSCL